MINEDVRHIIEPELVEDEELLWADKPSTFPINTFDVCVVIFFIWCASVLYNMDFSSFPANKYFSIIIKVMPFYLGLISLMPLFRAFLRNREVYAITSKRVILQSYVFKRSFQHLHNYKDIIQSGNRAVGTITFVPHGNSAWDVFALNMSEYGFFDNGFLYRWFFGRSRIEKLNKFYKVQNPEFVADLIRQHFLQPVKNNDPGFKTSRSARRRRRSI